MTLSVGLILLFPPPLTGFIVINYLSVLPAYQRLGLGRRLLDIGLDEVKGDDGRDAEIDSGIDTVIPIVEGDAQQAHDDSSDEPQVTANIYGHSGYEGFNSLPRDRADDPDGG